MSESFDPNPSPFAAPVPTPPPAPSFSPYYGAPATGQLVDVAPAAPTPKRKPWALLAGLAAVVAVGVGVAVMVGGDDDKQASSSGFSLSAAAEAAQSAQFVAYEMNIEAAGASSVISGRQDIAGQKMAMNMSVPGLGEQLDVVFDLGSGTMYMSAEAFAGSGVDVPTPWIGIDLSAQPGMEEALAQSTGNPLDMTKAFDTAKSVVEVGMEDFRGEQVKHFVVTVDMAAALVASPSMEKQFEALGDELPSEITYDAYVTADSQLRRLTYSMEIAGQTISAEMVFTALDSIEPIVIPGPDEVTDFSELMGG